MNGQTLAFTARVSKPRHVDMKFDMRSVSAFEFHGGTSLSFAAASPLLGPVRSALEAARVTLITVVVLRNPEKQVTSLYNWLCSADERARACHAGRAASPEAMLATMPTDPQCRYLLTSEWAWNASRPVSSGECNEVLTGLLGCDVAGISEDMPTVLQKLRRVLSAAKVKLQPRRGYERVNDAMYRMNLNRTLPAPQLQQLQQRTPNDRLMYERVRAASLRSRLGGYQRW